MKKMQAKSILLLALVLVVLAATVGGTVAYLAIRTPDVENTFTPATVEVEITDTVTGTTKNNVDVKNKSNIPVYMRVVVTANWCDASGKVVAPWNDYAGLPVKSGWEQKGIYYYYTDVVEVGETIRLFDSYTAQGGPAGAHLEMDIIAQVIQSAGIPDETYANAWSKAAANGN